MKHKKGFTLVELLVVIAIIGLLSTLSILALNSARARARDAKRVADIKQIQTALEMYYNDRGTYPSAVESGKNISTGSVVYMSEVPTAPTPADCTTGNGYAYTGIQGTALAGSYNTYTLTYCLGYQTGGLSAGPGTATPAGIKSTSTAS